MKNSDALSFCAILMLLTIACALIIRGVDKLEKKVFDLQERIELLEQTK